MIRPTGITADLSAIRAAVEGVRELVMAQGQVMIRARKGARDPLSDDIGWLPEGTVEADYCETAPEFRGTEIERLIDQLDIPVGRARIMLMKPKSTLSIHADRGLRYHFAVETAPDCFLVEVKAPEAEGEPATTVLHHIPADGRLYEMDAFQTHTAMNTGKCKRLHIVINAADDRRPADAPPIGRVRDLAL